MNALWVIIVTSIGYIAAYHIYGKFLSRRLFRLSDTVDTPATRLQDGQDYVPTSKGIVFGHHFTSIAGTGPIVGPAIGVIWGWVPALIWVFFGSIFIGAVHDLASLVVSLRNQGKSISDIAAKYLNARVRLMFFCVVFLGVWIVIAIFGLVIASIFSLFPESVGPVWAEIPIALILGWLIRKKWHVKKATWLAKIAMVMIIGLGMYMPIKLAPIWGIPETGIWTILLLGYAFIASVLPVDRLLQPRDYLNAWQLVGVLALIVVSIFVAGTQVDLTIPAPAFQWAPQGAPPLLPFLCITIACGAVSGFHCLVSSGTTSKQLKRETDAEWVGYGSMILEGFLAVLVIIIVTVGIGLAYEQDGTVLRGVAAWNAHYHSWTASAGLGSKLSAVVIGAANFLKFIGIPVAVGTTIMGVFIASFAATTLDTSVRIQRYVVTELIQYSPFKRWATPIPMTSIAVGTGLVLAFASGPNGKGALMLWPMFGAVNQLLAGLALMVGTAYIQTIRPKWIWVTGVPCIGILGVTLWASLINQLQFWENQKWLLVGINGLIVLLAVLMVVEGGIIVWNKGRSRLVLKEGLNG